ncbi:hypothetical protein SCHPADRAFT_143535 [Schizopora paradoxa]|uniref:Uncharacterized protein n=1 Tax=Schizopora paradoxa TaxID=27342 RepID=A0A0H2S1S2_9AGAM|nr:hypothetical protein SCHPADRAFT_143535 [Schizopora paradoxa]
MYFTKPLTAAFLLVSYLTTASPLLLKRVTIDARKADGKFIPIQLPFAKAKKTVGLSLSNRASAIREVVELGESSVVCILFKSTFEVTMNSDQYRRANKTLTLRVPEARYGEQ